MKKLAQTNERISVDNVAENCKPLIDTLPMEKFAQTNESISVDNVAENWQTK